MSQSPAWPDSELPQRDTVATAIDASASAGAAAPGTPQKMERGYGRLGPLQTAAATAVIFTSLVVLAAMTGVFSWNGNDEPVPLGAASPSPLRSAGGPVPRPAAALHMEPDDIITEIDNPPLALRSSPNQTVDVPKNSLSGAGTGAVTGAVNSGTAGEPGNAATPRVAPATPAPQVAAAAPQRSTRHVVPHQQHPQRAHAGKTREQVIEELMQAKRDGSYRALQENYR